MISRNLKDRIESWRAELSGKLSPDDLDELQSHLEDNINELLSKGISEDEAWLLAIHRMGSAETIRKEFQKVKDDRVPLVNKLFYLIIVIILAMQVINISRNTISFFLQVEQFPVFNSVLILILLFIIFWTTCKRQKRVKISSWSIVRSILLICLAFCFGFFSEFQEPGCNNSNKIFADNRPSSEVYNRELIRLFTRFGTDNLYYQFGFYFQENGRDYMMVKAIGKDFYAAFPLDITASSSPALENLIRVKGGGYRGAGLKGLKFDLLSNRSAVKFIFRDLERVLD